MKALYQAVTGDTAAHQRAIDARFRKLDPRRQRLIKARLEGQSLRQIAATEGVTGGSIQSAINTALESIRKELAGEPRYNREGRHRYGQAAASPDAATPSNRTA